MRGKQRLERRSTDPTRMQSETMTSPTGTRMLIGTLSGAVAVLRHVNGVAIEAMWVRTESCLRRRRQRRRQRRER